jgi:hypothetical protein
MDERTKTIRGLEEKKREAQGSINGILETLGESLLARINSPEDEPGAENGQYFSNELDEYRRILKDIADSEESIRDIEKDTFRLKELEEDIIRKEKGVSEKTKALSSLYARLGEFLLGAEEFTAFADPYRQQMEPIILKIRSLEDRLNELETGKQANVFAWIGKNAQGMVLRSLLGKSQDGLQRVYIVAGEKFVSINNPESVSLLTNAGARDSINEIFSIRDERSVLNEYLTKLRGERRKINDSFGADGTPAKRTLDQERHIIHAREQLRALYQRCGTRVSGTAAVDYSAGNDAPGIESALLSPTDTVALDRIGKLREAAAGYEASIEKLKASLAIDMVREEIAKMEKAIAGHKQKIAANEEAIVGLEKHIEESNRYIRELMNL